MAYDADWYTGLADVSTLSQILNIIIQMRDGITRTEIANATGFSKSTVSQYVDTLLSEGYIICPDMMEGRRRRLARLKLNKDYGYAVCVDMGVTSLNVAICNLIGEPLAHRMVEGRPSNIGPQETLSYVESTVRPLLQECGIADHQVMGVGMGVPSPIEFSTGRPIAPPLLHREWANFPVKDYLEAAFGKPAFVDNDVNLMAIAEHEAGMLRNQNNSLLVKLGTGIGCGIFCNGRIYRGSNGSAGDIGHIRIEGSDILCTCGNRGCLERLAGGKAIAQQAYQMAKSGQSAYLEDCLKRGAVIDCKSVHEAILEADAACIDYIQKVGGYIGEVLAKITNFYNPSAIILSGGLTNFGDILFSAVREGVYRRSSALATRDLVIQCSHLGDMAGVSGAAIMVRDEMFSPLEFGKSKRKWSVSVR